MKVIQTIHHYDVSVFLWVMARKTRRTMIMLARILSKTADGPPYLALGLALAYIGGEALGLLYSLMLALAMERPLYLVLKNSLRRNRPQAALNIQSVIVPSDRFSFPSGHTSAAFLVATLAGAFYPPLALPLLAWAVTVGMARVVLGVHFPTDTLVGALMGTALARLSLEILF